MFKITLTAALITVLTGTASIASPIVSNGSFETPFTTPGNQNNGQTFDKLQSGPGASWNIWTEIPGWTSTGDGIEIQGNRTLGVIDADTGSHYVELDSTSNSSMFQEVLLSQGEHVLSFAYSPRTTDAGTNEIGYGLGSLFSGTVTGPGAQTPRGDWTRVTQVFNVAAAGTYTLAFSAMGTSDSFGGLIDSVSIASRPFEGTTAVPLPGGVVLLASAGAALFYGRRLKRKV